MTASLFRLACFGCLVYLAPFAAGAEKRFRKADLLLSKEELAQISSVHALQAKSALHDLHAADSSNTSDAPNASKDPVLAAVLGSVGTVCFALMLFPQAWLNADRHSVEGMSLGLILLWHLAGIFAAAFYLSEQDVSIWVVLSMAAMVLLCSIIEGQVLAYTPKAGDLWTVILIASTVGFFMISAFVTFGLRALFAALPAIWGYVLGNLAPSVFFGLGFLPQIWIFFTTRSIEGYSFGVTAFDVVGSTANTAVLLLQSSVPQALAAAVPFLTIIAFHVFLVSVALTIIFCPEEPVSADKGEAKLAAD